MSALDDFPLPDVSRPDAERLRELARLEDASDALLVRESPVALSHGEPEPLACERQLEERMESLAQACAYPQTRLTRREEIVSLPRARRLSQRSITWLGGHPAAWAGRRGRGPVPERVLAEQPHPVVDIYENRVLATLLDRIDRHLLTRIRELEQMRSRLEERRLAEHGAWRMNRRVTALWAESWFDDRDVGGEALSELRDELAGRRRQIRALRRRPGYAEVPAARRRVRRLRITNIFRGDDRYHDVARLWRSFGAPEALTPDEQQRREDATRRGHVVFVRLLVLRALADALGPSLLDPLSEADDVGVTRLDDGTLRVAAPGAPPLEVRPIYCAVEPQLLAGVLEAPENDLLAIAQPPGELRGAPAWRAPGGGLTVVAESPAHLRAVESVGAMLRTHVLGARYGALPPPVLVHAATATTWRNAGVPLAVSGDQVLLLEPVGVDALERAEARLFPRSLRGPTRESLERSWRAARERIVDASKVYDRALPCPTPLCGAMGSVSVAARDRAVLACQTCDGRWGMQWCPHGHPVPFALAADEVQLLIERRVSAEQAFDVLGMQVIRPIAVREGRVGALCGECEAWTILPVSVRPG